MTRRRWIALGGLLALGVVGAIVVASMLLTSPGSARLRRSSGAIFQVRGSARTQAQVKQGQGRLAVRAASDLPHVHTFRAMLGGVPLLVTIPTGQQGTPLHIEVTGAPRASVRVIFTLGKVRMVQTRTLDGRGYASAAFTPSPPPRAAEHVRVEVTVTQGTQRAVTRETVTLLPGRSGAPPQRR